MEWVLRLFPLGGLGCSILLLLLAVVRNWHGGDKIPQESPALILIFQDYEDGVEGLVRWLLFQKWWLECSGPLMIGVEHREVSSYEHVVAILLRLQQRSQAFHLILAEEDFINLKSSNNVVIIKKNTNIPWQKLKGMLKNSPFQAA